MAASGGGGSPGTGGRAHLLETTAKVKYVREEVTKKLEQYRKQYEEMHIRALSAELEVSNLQRKHDHSTRKIESQQDLILTLINEIGREKSLQSSQTVALETARKNLSEIRERLRIEFDKIQTNQKDLRVGINSIMRCMYEFRTGVISQNDFLSAADLIFSSLEANDHNMVISPSSSTSPHLDVVFSRNSLHELASLPPEQRRKKLEKILDHLSPDVLFTEPVEDMLDNLFKIPSSLPPLPVSSPPVLPSRSKHISKAQSTPLFPPPLPPKPKSSTDHSHYGSSSRLSADDSDSDFEEVQGIRWTSRIQSEPNVNAFTVKPSVPERDRDRNELARPKVVKKKKKRESPTNLPAMMQRSKSCDLLQSETTDAYDSSENSGTYSFPFQHVEAWRKLIGLRDSSALTGSMPHLHRSLEGEESIYYIAPNEFRSIMTQVGRESVKMGETATEKVINRVDSFVRSRHSRGQADLEDQSGYLSLLGEGGGANRSSWLQKVRAQRESVKRSEQPARKEQHQRMNYENQSLKRNQTAPRDIPPRNAMFSLSPISSASDRTFDDPQYDMGAARKNDIYLDSPENSPSPPARLSTTVRNASVDSARHGFSFSNDSSLSGKEKSSSIAIKASTSPSVPPKRHMVDIQLRSSMVGSDNVQRAQKPVPRPRTKPVKSSTELSLPAITATVNDHSQPLESHTDDRPLSTLTTGAESDPLKSPAYFSLKRGTHSLQLIPQFYDSGEESEEEDPGSYSLGRFEFVETGKSNMSSASKPNSTVDVSDSDDDSSDGYEIPPDAAAGYIEPSTSYGSSIPRDRKYTATLPSSTNDSVGVSEKQGYMHKLDPRLKHWTRRWFVLRGKELKYYSKKTPTSRAKGVINLAAWCKVTRHEMTSSFQLATPTRTYHFVADSNTECEDWIKALQTVMRMCQMNLSSSTYKEVPAGWAKVKLSSWSQGHQKMWIALIEQSLVLYQDPNCQPMQSFPLVDAMVRHTADTPGFRCRAPSTVFSQVKEEFSIIVDVGGASTMKSSSSNDIETISLSLINKEEKDKWFYHLVSAASGETGPELTLTEKLVARLWRMEKEGGASSTTLWCNPILNFTTEAIQEPLISLPSSALSIEAVHLFKSIHLFISTPFDPLALDYHIVPFQQMISKCMSQPALHDELYCQVLRQISTPPSSADNHHLVLQSWFLLALLIPNILPRRKLFSWYFKAFLSRQRGLLGSHPTIVAQLANLCEQRLARTEKNGQREKKPSWYELHSLMSRPIHLTCVMQMKMAIPIHLLNDTSLTIDCDSCTIVQELISQLNQEIGMQDTCTTGFALLSDWPGEEDIDVFYLFPNSKLMDVISMWSDSLADLGNSSSHSRTIRLTYRNRLSLRSRRGQETDKEAVLLAYQYSKDILSDYYPVPTLDIALDIAARMSQIDYGDCSSVSNADIVAMDALRRFCCRRFTMNMLPMDMHLLGSRLLQKWEGYHGLNHHKCARMLLRLLEDNWELFGATLFYCKDQYGTLTLQKNANVWLAVHENGVSLLQVGTMKMIVSYTYKDIATFGGHCDDFMLVVNSWARREQVQAPPQQTEKIVLSMPKFKIREATYLMASYLDY